MLRRRAGFDVGSAALHIALRSKNGIERVVSEPLPEEGGLGFSAFIKEIRKKYRLRFDSAAAVLPQSECVCRRLKLPAMTDSQLRLNLEYELRDSTQGGDGWVYDYAVIGKTENGGLDIMAAAARKPAVEALRETFRRAGIRLDSVIPPEEAYGNLISGISGRICIVDLGASAVRLYIYSGGGCEMTQVVDGGCLDAVKAFAEGDSEFCGAVCRSLAEAVRSRIYFYGLSRPESVPERIYLLGGGASLPPLKEALWQALPVKPSDPRLLFDGGDCGCFGAIGASFERR